MSIRCTAKAHRTGEQCRRWAIEGGTVCIMHGGRAPAVRAKAAERVLEAKINGELVRRGWEPVTDPVRWYTDLAGEVRAFLELCRASLARLHGLDRPEPEGEGVAALVALYERALDRAQRTADQMTARGIEARANELAQEDAAAVVEFARQAVRLARAEPDLAPQDVLLRLLDGDRVPRLSITQARTPHPAVSVYTERN